MQCYALSDNSSDSMSEQSDKNERPNGNEWKLCIWWCGKYDTEYRNGTALKYGYDAMNIITKACAKVCMSEKIPQLHG